MKEKYEHIFYIYKKMCEGYKKFKAEEQIRFGIRMVNGCRDELCGMTVLMHEMGVLTQAEIESEQEKIRKIFSVSDMLGVFEAYGEIYRLQERR